MSRASRRPVDASPPSPRGGPGPARAARRPALLVVICGLVALQAVVLVGMAGAWGVELVRGAAQLPAATVFLALFALGVAAVLVLCVRGLWAGRRGARAPVLTWQVLLVVMAAGWLGYDVAAWAVAVLAGALVVGVGLLVPSVVRATVDGSE